MPASRISPATTIFGIRNTSFWITWVVTSVSNTLRPIRKPASNKHQYTPSATSLVARKWPDGSSMKATPLRRRNLSIVGPLKIRYSSHRANTAVTKAARNRIKAANREGR